MIVKHSILLHWFDVLKTKEVIVNWLSWCDRTGSYQLGPITLNKLHGNGSGLGSTQTPWWNSLGHCLQPFVRLLHSVFLELSYLHSKTSNHWFNWKIKHILGLFCCALYIHTVDNFKHEIQCNALSNSAVLLKCLKNVAAIWLFPLSCTM